MLYNVVDRIYIGHMPEVGDLALTGVGVCMPIILFVSAFAALISCGGASEHTIGYATDYTAEPVADVLAVTFTAILFCFQFKKAMREISVPLESL